MQYKRGLYHYRGFVGLTIKEALDNFTGYKKRKAFEEALKGAKRFHGYKR